MKRMISTVAVLAILSLATAPVMAGEGTRDEAVAMVHKVQDRIKADGADKTFDAINAKEFNDRDLYPFVIRFDGNMAADGINKALVGKNLSGVKDPDGKSPGDEMLSMAKSGHGGWVDYSWPNPATKKIEAKSVYVERAGDADFLIAVSVYR